MASSEVEIASSAPFGCVLRDRGPSNGCKDINTRAARAALQNAVGDRLINCMIKYDQSNPANFRIQNEERSPRKWGIHDRLPTRQVNQTEQQQEAADSPDSSDSSLASSSETCTADISTLAASSLVQIWEQRLTPSSSSKISSCSSPTSCRSSSGLSNRESTFCVQKEKKESQADETDKTQQRKPQQQSDHEVSSSQSNAALANSKAGERLRVVDIIKRLSAASEDNDLEPSCSDKNGSPVLEHHADHRTMVISSPRLRGRQAFNDLLMLMERDRYEELHALAERAPVSKFTQRGRIQSLLRLRLLQREVAAYDPPYLEWARVSEVRRKPQGTSSIGHLRKAFNHIGHEHGTKVQSEAGHKRSSPGTTVKNRIRSNRSLKNGRCLEDNPCPGVVENAEVRGHIVQESVSGTRGYNAKIETTSVSGSTNVEDQKAQEMVEPTESMEGCNVYAINPDLKATIVTSAEAKPLCSKGISESTPCMGDQKVNTTGPEVDDSMGISFVVRDLNSQEIAKAPFSMDGCDDHMHIMVQESEASSLHYDEMTEEIYESYPYDHYETSYDWIADIARPRSYWENLRQEWYKEMLSSGSDNNKEDIRQLIERRTVSTFLSSDFRERMDKLMACHLGRQSNLTENEEDAGNREFELVSFLREHSDPAGCQQGEHETENETEKEQEQREDVSLTSSPYHHRFNNEFVQSPSSTEISSPSLIRSWICKDSDTAMDDSDRASSPSSLYDASRQSSCSYNNSSVMELICELRGQMQQLYQQMADLKKSIKGCVDMKVSMTPELHSCTAGEGRNSCDGLLKKGNCWVCREAKANTVLYRCGHMCACHECADELYSSSGKCPICSAAIVDVVRVYMDKQGENR